MSPSAKTPKVERTGVSLQNILWAPSIAHQDKPSSFVTLNTVAMGMGDNLDKNLHRDSLNISQ